MEHRPFFYFQPFFSCPYSHRYQQHPDLHGRRSVVLPRSPVWASLSGPSPGAQRRAADEALQWDRPEGGNAVQVQVQAGLSRHQQTQEVKDEVTMSPDWVCVNKKKLKKANVLLLPFQTCVQTPVYGGWQLAGGGLWASHLWPPTSHLPRVLPLHRRLPLRQHLQTQLLWPCR